MRVLALSILCLLTACASPNRELETHLALTDAHLDRLAQSIDALNAKFVAQPHESQAPPPKIVGVVCRDTPKGTGLVAVDSLKPGERNLGMREHCPAPRDFVWCIGGLPESDVMYACAEGKLDELLNPPKKDAPKKDEPKKS